MTITTTNLILLDAALKKKFQELFKAEKRNTIALAKEAFQIHGEHYHVAERKYDKYFEKWWTTQAMDRVFGSRTNWTKWHRAGEAIEKVHARFVDYVGNLPMNRDALYEIAMLQADELRLCLENKYTRTSITESEAEWKQSKKPQPVINPRATAGSIRSWRKKWREPSQPRTDKRTLPFVTIRLHGSLYDFDKFGHPSGLIAAGQAVEINQRIIDFLKPLDVFVRVESRLEQLLAGYDKRRVAAENWAQKAALIAKRKK
jgi:hypothetical protein